MTETFDIRPVPLSLRDHRDRLEEMLARNGLRFEPVDTYLGIYDAEDNLLGGGGLKDNVIKCVAIDSSLRGENLANTLVSCLRSEARRQGHRDIFIFTKPENEQMFRSLAFYTVGRTPLAVLMESNPRGLKSYTDSLAAHKKDGRVGVIVMNCNPMTHGHLALIENAALSVDHLFVMVVAEDKSQFTFSERFAIVSDQLSDYNNITVVEGSRYSISTATFPSYFLKEIDSATDTSILLDLDIFGRHIAPALGASIRFVGSEPTDALTARYNEIMKEALPKNGIEVVEMPRVEANGHPISASKVRALLDEGKLKEAMRLLPESSKAGVLAHLAAAAMRSELDLTPKPGLVDCEDNGAHRDMNHGLMAKSIRAITPGLMRIAKLAFDPHTDISRLQSEGMRVEQEMFEATDGVNTHKGAIFAFSLAVAATASLLNDDADLNAENLSMRIASMARGLRRDNDNDTHGAKVIKKYGVSGALAAAEQGYRGLTEKWFPYYRTHKDAPHAELMTLLEIIASIDDTNVLHRCGPEVAAEVKAIARQMQQNISIENMRKMNEWFKERNISPGGAADMLALTIYYDKITT